MELISTQQDARWFSVKHPQPCRNAVPGSWRINKDGPRDRPASSARSMSPNPQGRGRHGRPAQAARRWLQLPRSISVSTGAMVMLRHHNRAAERRVEAMATERPRQPSLARPRAPMLVPANRFDLLDSRLRSMQSPRNGRRYPAVAHRRARPVWRISTVGCGRGEPFFSYEPVMLGG